MSARDDLAEGLRVLLLDLAADDTVSPEVYEKVCRAVFSVLNAWAER
jgi:hypothetical protein